MSMRAIVSLGFIANGVLGNFCMLSMPQAFASDMPMPHEEHMEMTMTPMVPMSTSHCDHCAKVQSSDGDQSQQSGCAGHCFSQAQSTTANAAFFNAPHIVAATPIPITVAFDPQISPGVTASAQSPPTSIHIDTIVLRL